MIEPKCAYRIWIPSFLISPPIHLTGTPPQHSKTFFRSLFEGNETGRVGGTDTGSTVLDGLAARLLEEIVHCHGGEEKHVL